MDPKLMSLFLATAATFVVPSLARAGPEDDRGAVSALDLAFQAAVKRNDAAAMDAILHHDFTLVLGDGRAISRDDLLKEARAGRRPISAHNARRPADVRSGAQGLLSQLKDQGGAGLIKVSGAQLLARSREGLIASARQVPRERCCYKAPAATVARTHSHGVDLPLSAEH